MLGLSSEGGKGMAALSVSASTSVGTSGANARTVTMMRLFGWGMRYEVSVCGMGGTLMGSLVTEREYGFDSLLVSDTSLETKEGVLPA